MSDSRDLLALRGMPSDEIRGLLARAWTHLRAIDAGGGWGDSCRGKSVANLFFEDSTRTRVSFTLAARRLGAEVVDLATAGSSVNKGETLRDTARTIEAMGVDALVIRHARSGAAACVAREVQCPVLNAGDGRHEHPTQGLLDALTFAEAHDRAGEDAGAFDLSGLRLAILGDIANSRVARSDIAVFAALGARVVCVGPPGLAPASLAALGCSVERDLDAALPEVDGVQTLRIQFERSASIASVRDYAQGYQIDQRRARLMKPGAVLMHPGPMNRCVEVTPEVADGERSLVLRQVRAGVAVRMAAIERALRSAE